MVLSRSRTGLIKLKSLSMANKTCLDLNTLTKTAPKKYFRGGDLKHPMHPLHHEIAGCKFQYVNNRKTEIS